MAASFGPYPFRPFARRLPDEIPERYVERSHGIESGQMRKFVYPQVRIADKKFQCIGYAPLVDILAEIESRHPVHCLRYVCLVRVEFSGYVADGKPSVEIRLRRVEIVFQPQVNVPDDFLLLGGIVGYRIAGRKIAA